MVESGDTVKHLSNTLFDKLPMTVYEIENGKAYCGNVNDKHQLIAEWFNLDELIVIIKGNTHG